ncbi:MAG TPA: hypothetical protein VKU38_15685 [Ktedonobacteraceae bacterium]|nr:hypothetical protein [Ktedonobacteraceae bacterium]
MASINCPKCGMTNNSRGTFCGNCGYAFQADGAATSSPSQGQPGGAPPPPPPSSYPASNMPSSPIYPAGQTPPPLYPHSNISSSPIYPAGGSPPPPSSYPTGNMAAPPTYVGGGAPLPSSSSPSYPTDRVQFPQADYPKSDPNMPPAPRRKSKKGLIAILAIVVIVILASAVGVFEYNSHKSASITGSSTSTPGTTATTVSTTAPSAPTADANATGTAIALTGSSTSTPGTTPTAVSSTPTPGTNATPTTVPSGSNYSAAQPGPGCDTSGGTWTPQGISNITCGTTISVGSANARGYLYLQLPNNESFSPNNIIGVTATVRSGYDCVGLAEQDANTGYLVEFCGTGNWNIYSITSGGATIKTLAQSITSTRSSEQLSLSIKGNTLTFTIDTEVHTITVTPIHPVKVAITFITSYGNGGSEPVSNFSYTVQ